MIFEEDDSSPGTDEDGLMDGGLVDIVSLGKGRAYSVLIKVIFSLIFVDCTPCSLLPFQLNWPDGRATCLVVRSQVV